MKDTECGCSESFCQHERKMREARAVGVAVVGSGLRWDSAVVTGFQEAPQKGLGRRGRRVGSPKK